MSENGPRIRGGYAQTMLDAIEHDARRARILEELDPIVVARVRAASPFVFIDGADYHAILQATARVLDGDELVAFIRAQTNRLRDAPFMASSIRALLGIVGATPHALLRHLPRLRAATVRDYGVITYAHVDERRASFVLEGYPDGLMDDANRRLFIRTFLAVLDLAGAEGAVEVSSEDAATGRAEYLLSWGPAD